MQIVIHRLNWSIGMLISILFMTSQASVAPKMKCFYLERKTTMKPHVALMHVQIRL